MPSVLEHTYTSIIWKKPIMSTLVCTCFAWAYSRGDKGGQLPPFQHGKK